MEFCYRRKLPHWRKGPGRLFRYLAARGREEPDASERDLVMAAIKSFDGQRYQLAAYVVMDGSCARASHAVCWVRDSKAIPHSWKSFTARQMQRDHQRFGRVWQDECFDRIVRDDEEFAQSLITLSEIPGSAGLRSGTTPGSGRWTGERL